MALALVQMISALRQGISPPGPGYAWRAGMFPDSLVFWPIVCVEGLPLSEASARVAFFLNLLGDLSRGLSWA